MKYFPILRGKREEMIALRDLAEEIASCRRVVPIIEPVVHTATVKKSFPVFIEKSMPFILIVNPQKGKYRNDARSLAKELINPLLNGHGIWMAGLYVDAETRLRELSHFLQRYSNDRELAIFYTGQPKGEVWSAIQSLGAKYQIYMAGEISQSLISEIPLPARVRVKDPCPRPNNNAEYRPGPLLFTEMNTMQGNPEDINFGDFSIQGNHFMGDRGGRAYTVALHHVHVANSVLFISHLKSRHGNSPADLDGKTTEAITKLVSKLPDMHPNDTAVCDEYRELKESEHPPQLAYLKRLGIKHHLEVMLRDGVLEGED